MFLNKRHNHPGVLAGRDLQRFLSKILKTDGCWLWQGGRIRAGCGHFGIRHDGLPVTLKAHRAAYATFKGPIAVGLAVCHSCDNPTCVNPDHLFLGTGKDNALDREHKGRRPNLRGEANGSSKLSEQDVSSIRLSFSHGENKAQLSRRFGVSRTTVRKIVNRQAWSFNVPEKDYVLQQET